MNVGILIKGGYRIDGMVNSESDFNENLVKNVKRNKERLVMAKVVETLICPLLKPGAVISVKKMNGYK